ncbi:MAG: acyl-ACP--UDP-N-acetylglucosamine O-acyltransferase [Cocleimonas sp.]|nr:acyl-ACP--UDP-N-acetylglucosamine O-acyltransferase [Cocleimonas sp.]
MNNIHPTAIIDTKAELADDVEVSPYAVIGAGVKMDSGCWVGPHAVIEGPTTIGKDNRFFQFSSVGAEPQDKKYKGEPTTLEIGDRNVIRENVTINRGTVQDIGKTVIGNDNWIMAYVHIAHDCIVGNNTIFANNATLAGHVTIHDYALLGGFTLVHQFCHIGEYAMTGMGTSLGKDLPPYITAYGAPGVPRGFNNEGLKRNGFTAEQRSKVKDAYKTLYRKDLPLSEAIEALQASDDANIQLMAEFCKRSQSGRGIIR